MEKAMDSASAKINAVSAVIAATVVAIGVIIAAVILAGGDFGREQSRCMTVNGGGAANAMKSSMVRNAMMMDGTREIGMQKVQYDYDANTIVVDTADNSTPATVAIDYDRSVVFIELHGQSLCLASALHGDMMDMAGKLTNFMRDSRKQVLDRATASIVQMNYVRIGVIPAGYVTNANGPIIRTLCAGDESYWTEQIAGGGRKRRQISGSVEICVFGFCFNIGF